MSKKGLGATAISVSSIVLALVALTPEDWANNIASWKTILLFIAGSIVIGIACDELSKQSYDFWMSFLADRNGRLKMIFVDPNGIQIGLREKMVCGGTSEGEFADSVKYNMRILYGKINRIRQEKQEETINAHIKVNDFPPVINCIITDRCVFFASLWFSNTWN